MIDRRHLMMTATAGGALAVSGCGLRMPGMEPVAPVSPETAMSGSDPQVVAAANAIYDRAFQQALGSSPEGLTSLGLDRQPLFAWARSRLDDRTVVEFNRQADQNRVILNELKALDRSRVTGMDAVNYDTLVFVGETAEEGRQFDYGARGFPQAYVVNQLASAYIGIPDFLDSNHVVENADDMAAYLSRVEAYGTALDQETERAIADAGRGAAPTDFMIDKALLQLRGARSTPATQAVLTLAATRKATEAGLPDAGPEAARLIESVVYPALDRQIAALEAMRPTATHDAGVWRLPDGEAYYDWGLKTFTTTNMTGEEVHAMGLEQVAYIEGQMDALMRQNGLTQGTTGERLTAMGRDPRFLYPNTDEGKAQLLADLNGQIQVVTERIRPLFGQHPRAPVEVRRVPPSIEAGAPGGYYNSPSLDGTRPGAYYINLRDTAENPSWTLPTLTYHEANPGHHWQITLAQEAEGIPMIRKVVGFSAYSEGWALYAEQLADEIGMYADDPWGKIGYLQSFLFRAVRLVVDSGMHKLRWSREQGIRYMTEHLGEPESNWVTEIERYCVWPGQACSYKVGQTVWDTLRTEARQTMGDRFDLAGFHDAGLLAAAMPLAVLERRIRDWARSA
ncbi:DUF885 domain-containing protein [Brevundimonas aveniformis]|uniref:DUF885 domain-containing protein n=1 Tax=Brevundimonas aveniformis TaxID=370977 RepID=UPI0003F9BCD3|nr:DUF885 family protein [Brevundimonas aveniformis]